MDDRIDIHASHPAIIIAPPVVTTERDNAVRAFPDRQEIRDAVERTLNVVDELADSIAAGLGLRER